MEVKVYVPLVTFELAILVVGVPCPVAEPVPPPLTE
jgi:hypothetical protein